jgi:hypothetical protein
MGGQNPSALKSGLWFSACELPVQPGRNFFRPTRTVLAQSFIAEMHALSFVVPQVSNKGIAVGAFQRNAGRPERPLCCTDISGASIFGSVITGLRDKPWNFPTSFSAGIAD